MKYKGTPISTGIGIGNLIFIDTKPVLVKTQKISNIESEFVKFDLAVSQSIQQIENIKENAKNRLSNETLEIFDAHLMIASDSEIKSKVQTYIKDENISAAYALNQVANEYIEMFLAMDDAYFKERALDIKDVTQRLIKNLLNIPIVDLESIDEPTILAIDDLTPSMISQLNTDYIKGIITRIGGKTSHSAIIARLLGLPMISNLNVETLKSNTKTIIDGSNGTLIIEPTDEELAFYLKLHEDYLHEQQEMFKWIGKKSQTKDGHEVLLVANIGSPSDVAYTEKYDAEGVGLMRTEFLFLDSNDFPTEEEQFEAYKTVLQSQGDKPVVIRTIDIGGDKVLPYLKMEHEDNPFLGVRAIRLAFKELELFKTQIRALLRASVYGNLKIMFPMIAIKDEFLKAKSIVLEIKDELLSQNVKVNDFEIGMMVEIPSSALMADDLATVVDFFSIGTNDLIQYTMASDRTNPHLSYLYQPLNPAILRLINMVTSASKKHNLWTGVCGEMASEVQNALMLIGLGVEELSMSPANILKVRRALAKYNYKDLQALAQKALTLSTEHDIIMLIDSFIKKGE